MEVKEVNIKTNPKINIHVDAYWRQHRVCLMAGDRVARSVNKFIYIRVGGQIRWIYPPLNKPKTLAVIVRQQKSTEMQNQIIVRKGQKNDLAELQKLFVDTITTICAVDYNEQQIEVWTSSVENKQRWNEIITKQFILVAQDQEKIVGFATLDNENYFDFLYVHKDHQRQGIAQQLYDEIELEARRLKQAVLTSDVSKTAKPFFEKMGFKTLEK